MPKDDKYSSVLKADVLTTESGEHYYKGDEAPLEELAKDSNSSVEKEKKRLGEAEALYTSEELKELKASNEQQEEARQAEIVQTQDATLEELSERDKVDAESASQEKVSTRGRPRKK